MNDQQSYEERQAELQQTKGKIAEQLQREMRDVQARTAAAHARAADAERVADDDAVAVTRKVKERLATELHASLSSLVKQWRDQPSRPLALKFGDTFTRFDERSKRELGAPMWESVIIVAFANEIVAALPLAVNAFGRDDWGTVNMPMVAQAFARSFAFGAHAIEAAIGAIENELGLVAGRAAGPARDLEARRFALKSRVVTHGNMVQTLGAFDAEEAAKQQARFEATYVPPSMSPPPMR